MNGPAKVNGPSQFNGVLDLDLSTEKVLGCRLLKSLAENWKQGVHGPDRSVATGGEIGKLSRASNLAPLGEIVAAPIMAHV